MGEVKPKRVSSVICQDMENEVLLYDSEREIIHALNSTAHLIWTLCDGQHTIEDMEQTIRASFSVPCGHDVMGDIRKTLEIFAAKGLLESVT